MRADPDDQPVLPEQVTPTEIVVTVSRSPQASVIVSSQAAASTSQNPQRPMAMTPTLSSGVSFVVRDPFSALRGRPA